MNTSAPTIPMDRQSEKYLDEGLSRVREYRPCSFDTSSVDVCILGQGAKNMCIIHDTVIKLTGMETTMSGSTLNPLVSSSKNLIKPPLDAGSGALFLLLIMP